MLSGPTLWHEEGAQTTVVVTGHEMPVHGRVLYLNGRHQANDTAAMVFIHRRIGLLPAVLHAHPRQALVVGLGGGATAGGLSQFPGLDVDVVELSGEVVPGAAFFSHVNFDVLNRSNVTTRVDDGRNHLLRTTTRYDIITADAILPHHAGSNNLNSVEYFRLVRDRLAPDGVALHWNCGTTGAEYQMILRAFVEAFPLATLWGDGTLMVGVKEPLTVSRRRVEGLLADPAARQALNLMNIQTFDHLVRMFRASPDDIRTYFAGMDSSSATTSRPSSTSLHCPGTSATWARLAGPWMASSSRNSFGDRRVRRLGRLPFRVSRYFGLGTLHVDRPAAELLRDLRVGSARRRSGGADAAKNGTLVAATGLLNPLVNREGQDQAGGGGGARSRRIGVLVDRDRLRLRRGGGTGGSVAECAHGHGEEEVAPVPPFCLSGKGAESRYIVRSNSSWRRALVRDECNRVSGFISLLQRLS